MDKPIPLSQHKSSPVLNILRANKSKDLSGGLRNQDPSKSKNELSGVMFSPAKRKNVLAKINQSNIFLSSKTIVQSPRARVQLKLNRTSSEASIDQTKKDSSSPSPQLIIPSLPQFSKLKRVTSPSKQASAKLDFLIKSKPSKPEQSGVSKSTISEKTMTL